jgi:DNA polymerase
MDLLAALRLQIEWGADEAIADTPVDRLRLGPPPAQAAHRPSSGLVRPTSQPPPAGPRPPAPVLRAQEVAASARTLDELRDALARFDGCPLAATATNLVLTDGNPDAGLMFIGEGPGAEEDRVGKPFVGPSGQFLDRMLASIGLDRSRFLITNLIPWRPPGNRNPTDSEVLICLPFLHRQIALVRPRRLVVLGNLVTSALLADQSGIRRLRGKWRDVTIPGHDGPIPALPMFHPAYLLRMPGAKRDAWADLILLRRNIDTEP